MAQAYPQFRERNVSLAAISVDDRTYAFMMADLVGAEYPVLADATQSVTKTYGVYNLLNDDVAAPATFIIRPNGGIAWRHIAEDIVDRPASADILAEIDRLLIE